MAYVQKQRIQTALYPHQKKSLTANGTELAIHTGATYGSCMMIGRITGRCSPYNEARPLCLLLGHLLSFYSTCVLSAESEVGDGNIIEVYVEILRSLRQDAPDISADHLRANITIMTGAWDSRQQ